MHSSPVSVIMKYQGQKAESRSCLHDKTFELGTAKHEEVAIYEVNLRIPNVCRIAGATKQRSNS